MPTSSDLESHHPLRILVLRLGSMGDIIHAMPAVTVLRRMLPDAILGWVVEERWRGLLSAGAPPSIEGLASGASKTSGQGRVLQHAPLVDVVHTLDTLRWRRALRSGQTWRDMQAALQGIRAVHYDVVVDLQGAWKTAMLANLSGAPVRLGFRSPREPLASMLYNRQYIATELHVIEQNMGLAWALLDACPDGMLNRSNRFAPVGGPASVERLPREGQRVRTLPVPRRTLERRGLHISTPTIASRSLGTPCPVLAEVGELEFHLGERRAEMEHHRTTAVPRVPFPNDPQADRWCDAELARLQVRGREFAIMNPGAGWGAKCWPVERFAEVAQQLSRDGLSTVVNYGPNEEVLARKLETLSGGAAIALGCSVPELIALTRRARLFIGGDTGPLHLAAALGIPAVAIFGPTDPVRNGPFGTASALLSSHETRTSHARPHARLPETGEPLTNITAAQVLAAARQLLAATSPWTPRKGQSVE